MTDMSTAAAHDSPATSWRSAAMPVAVVAASAASGPTAMWLAGFRVTVWWSALLALGLGLVLVGPVPTGPRSRVLALTCAALALSAATGLVAGVWLVLGAIYGEWVLLGRPTFRFLPRPPNGAVGIVLLMLVPSWILPNDVALTIPVTLSTAIGLILVAGAPATRPRRWAGAAVVVAVHAVIAVPMTEDLNVVPSVLLLVASMVVVAVTGRIATPGDWSVTARLGALLWAAPAMAWAMVNVGIWVLGTTSTASIGHAAWREGVSRFGVDILWALAVTGVPVCVLALLAIGAHLATVGASAARTITIAVLASVAAAAVVAYCWTVQVLPTGFGG